MSGAVSTERRTASRGTAASQGHIAASAGRKQVPRAWRHGIGGNGGGKVNKAHEDCSGKPAVHQTVRPLVADEVIIDKTKFRFKSETEDEIVFERRPK